MKLQRIIKIFGYLLPIFVFFSGTIFLSAFFAKFIIDSPMVSPTLGSLESSNSEISISFDSSFDFGTGEAPYYITSRAHCNTYDENFNCVDSAPNLCPYIALQPKNEEPTEIGFTQNPFGFQATGELNRPIDEIDTWNLNIKSPCFEGQCPADYDESVSGAPLPQSLKGQIFKCDLEVGTNDIPPLVKNYFMRNVAYADSPSSLIEISATLTGELAGCTSDCFSNVLFLPGLEASRLYDRRTDGSEDQLWEPNGNSDVEALYLGNDGTSINSDIYTRDIIKETNTPIPTGPAGQNIYKSFANAMEELVSDQKINGWKEYAYDWRQDINDILNNGTKYESGNLSLSDTLQFLADTSKNGKVTIVAHSNGGLLAKALLKKLQAEKNAGINNLIDKVDVLILIAVPEIGTAGAVPAILHGYDQRIMGGWLMDEVHARELGRNMLGAYGLLPSKEYINHMSASPATFVDTAIPSNVTTQMVQTFGSAISSYDEYKDFLFGEEGRVNPAPNQTNLPINLSQNLFTKAEDLHDNVDGWIPPGNLRVIEVAGWGLETIASFEYYPKCGPATIGCNFILDERPRFTSDGDGTVVVPSAHYMNFLGNAEKYWVNINKYNDDNIDLFGKEHKNILEIGSLLDFISNKIININQTSYNYLTTTTPIDTENRLRLSIHSPVTLDAYDADGNHTGKICPPNSDFCYVDENIPNSSYLEFGEGKYLNLPEDKAKSIKLQATDVGTFTYVSEKVLPDGTSSSSSFVDIPVTEQTQAEITLGQAGTPEMKLDVTGDGVMDFTINPNDTFDPVLYLQIMKATIGSLDLPSAKIKAFNLRVDNIIKLIQKGKIDKAKLKADKFKHALEKKLAKPDPKKPKPKKLSKTDAQLLLDMLNKLLDNLS